jgi:hypothetical protein
LTTLEANEATYRESQSSRRSIITSDDGRSGPDASGRRTVIALSTGTR